ncbi:E3 ubiquitin-protein ligase DTX3L-like [Hyperolius riggenbachi]|uniref:E3 ubiquitin-protein ligase DTX3L-like n=1 Tax=Hyperolius riggenbachi TaxID=752182 RepID=UPI0035A2C33E
MAETPPPTTYPVALKWDQGPDKLKQQLKNKLQIYFQSKTAEGGECEILDTDCSQGYVLIHFKERAAQEGVLRKKSHELKGDGKSEKLYLKVFPVEEIKTRIVSSPADNAAAAPPSSSHDADLPGAAEGHTEGQYAKRANMDTNTSTGQEEDPPQPEANDDGQRCDSHKRRKHHNDDVTNSDSPGSEGGSRSGPPNSWTGDEDDQNSETVTKKMSEMDVRNNDVPRTEKGSTSGPPDSGDGDSQRITHQSSTLDYGSGGAGSPAYGGSAEHDVREDRRKYNQGYPGDTGVNRWGEASSDNYSKYGAENPGNSSDTFREDRGKYGPRYPGDTGVNKWGEASSDNYSKYGAENPGNSSDTFREDRGGYGRRYPEGDTGVNKGGGASSHNDSRYEAENPGNSSDTNASGRPINVQPRQPLRPPARPHIEIFTSVTASLPTDIYNKTLRGNMAEMFPGVAVKESSDGALVKGTFMQIDAVHSYLQQELSGEMRSATQSEESGQEMKTDHVCVPTALCDYVMEVYQMKVQDMEGRYKVKLVPEPREDGTTYIKFIPQGPGSSVEAAKERFTEKVQTTMNDWCQETVDSSSALLPFSDIKQCLRSQFSNLLVIEEGKKIILRGPKEELFQAKKCLEKGQYEPAHPPRPEPAHPPRPEPAHPPRPEPAHPPRPVSISNRDMKTEIPVDARHLDILRKLKHQEICDIEKKYNVMLAEKKEKNGIITFRPVNGSPDLSPHAAHSFITLLQKTFFNIKQKVISVKSDVSQDQVSVLEEQLKMGGVNVIMIYSTGSVAIIGHTSHIAFAEEMLTGHQKLGRAPAVAPPKGNTEEPMDTSDSASSKPKPEEEEDKCPVCQYEIKDKVTFPKCKHGYCRPCLKALMSHKPVCAICGVASGEVRGNQPEGTMTWRTSSFNLSGFPGCGTIEISYSFPSGTQKENHPHPGRPYSGTSRTAYLPDNAEGRDILRLLRKAFDQRLIFTVGDSRTTGNTDTVTWNDVHHKTNMTGGSQYFGYPDPDYLKRVRDELKAKGVE